MRVLHDLPETAHPAMYGWAEIPAARIFDVLLGPELTYQENRVL
jgi:hypothetical protein